MRSPLAMNLVIDRSNIPCLLILMLVDCVNRNYVLLINSARYKPKDAREGQP